MSVSGILKPGGITKRPGLRAAVDAEDVAGPRDLTRRTKELELHRDLRSGLALPRPSRCVR